MSREVRRSEVFLVDLNPTRGSEIRKTRPCVIVSPDELNAYLRTFIVAPLTLEDISIRSGFLAVSGNKRVTSY